MLRTSDIAGMAVFAPKSGRKRAVPVAYAQLGKVRCVVFAPGGRRVAGVLVRRPDIAGMVKRDDIFVALDSLAPVDGGLRVTRDADSYDDAARQRLRLDWDACILWLGMDVATENGRELGYVGDAVFRTPSGELVAFLVGDGGLAHSLVGSIEVPASMLVRYDHGKMIVSNEAAHLALTGGLAAQAGAAMGKAQSEGARAAAKAGRAAGKAMEAGSRSLGRQLGKTKGMFGAFMDEYRKASE